MLAIFSPTPDSRQIRHSSIMAAFVSLATCPQCPISSTRHGLIYRDSLSVLSRNLTGPGFLYAPPCPRMKGVHSCRPSRLDSPEPVLLSRSRLSGSMRHLVVAHLRKLLMLSPAHKRRRGHQLQG